MVLLFRLSLFLGAGNACQFPKELAFEGCETKAASMCEIITTDVNTHKTKEEIGHFYGVEIDADSGADYGR